MATDLNSLVSVLQTQNQILNSLVTALKAGIVIDPTPTSYTVATLPATAGAGITAWASNARKIGEGSGAGSGLLVYFNPATATWFTVSGNILVTS